jgi:ferredoxin
LSTTIFYYTGSGNSLWTARAIEGNLDGAEVVSMTRNAGGPDTRGADVVGLVFPVHMWGVPRRVLGFVKALEEVRPVYVFAVAVNAGQVSNTLVQLKVVLAKKGIALAAGFGIVMPSNYIPWGGPGPEEQRRKRYAAAEEKAARIAEEVRERRTQPVEKGPLWQRVVFSALYRISFTHVSEMDKSFWVDEKCNSCGICAKVCPADNITISEGKPVWNHRCEQCLACIQWCPQEAIQYGKKTPGYRRYHHPGVTVKDMVR